MSKDEEDVFDFAYEAAVAAEETYIAGQIRAKEAQERRSEYPISDTELDKIEAKIKYILSDMPANEVQSATLWVAEEVVPKLIAEIRRIREND